MTRASIARKSIVADRLILRPTTTGDADRAVEIQSDWDVARMLRMATFPPNRQEMQAWFADHQREWQAGEAYRFVAELDGRVIGVADLDNIERSQGELGYWFEKSAWGHGYAFEAARALVQFGFRDVGLIQLKAGHAADNPASGRVLSKLGFKLLDRVETTSRSRGHSIEQCRYLLTFSD